MSVRSGYTYAVYREQPRPIAWTLNKRSESSKDFLAIVHEVQQFLRCLG